MWSGAVRNASFPWNDWQAAVRLYPGLNFAFIGPKRQITLPPMTIMARFVTPGTDHQELRPWWITTSALERIADASCHVGHSTAVIARDRLALSVDWNRTMQSFLVYRLTSSYGAWLGRAARQPLWVKNAASPLLSGGEYQLYVAGLQKKDLQKVGTALAFFSVPRSSSNH